MLNQLHVVTSTAVVSGGEGLAALRYAQAISSVKCMVTLLSRMVGLLRRLAYALDRDFGARLLGGETLMVLARPRKVS